VSSVQVFDAVVRQEIGFFDVTRTGELTNRLASDTQVIQNACTVNVSMLARYLAQVFGSIVIMAVVSWKLTLVLLR
jgi:ABC-type multidrug transport system fused ATPase/permease subunit